MNSSKLTSVTGEARCNLCDRPVSRGHRCAPREAATSSLRFHQFQVNKRRIRGGLLVCTDCCTPKPPEAYWRATAGLKGRFARCIACCKARKKNRKSSGPRQEGR